MKTTTMRLTIAAFLTAIPNLSAATHYVSPESAKPTPPYTNWATLPSLSNTRWTQPQGAMRSW